MTIIRNSYGYHILPVCCREVLSKCCMFQGSEPLAKHVVRVLAIVKCRDAPATTALLDPTLMILWQLDMSPWVAVDMFAD